MISNREKYCPVCKKSGKWLFLGPRGDEYYKCNCGTKVHKNVWDTFSEKGEPEREAEEAAEWAKEDAEREKEFMYRLMEKYGIEDGKDVVNRLNEAIGIASLQSMIGGEKAEEGRKVLGLLKHISTGEWTKEEG